jgi:hypothetical protein
LDLVSLILTGAGLFFLLLLFIAILLPWITITAEFGGFHATGSRNGFGAAIGIILFILTLLTLAAVITAVVLNFTLRYPQAVDRVLSYSIAGAAWLGILAFWCLLAGLFRPWGLGDYAQLYDNTNPEARAAARKVVGTGFGLWMSFFCALFLAGIFGFLAFLRPPELPLSRDPNAFTRRWLLLVVLGGLAVFLGLLVLLIHVI